MTMIRRVPEGEPSGVPVLFVHGAWHGAGIWEPHFLPHFAARGHPAFAVHLRGHRPGDPPMLRRGLRVRDYVEDVVEAFREIVRETGIQPVIVGHSMGAFVVQHYLRAHDAPAAVLLASVPPGGAFGASVRELVRHPLPFLRTLGTARLWPIVSDPARARSLLVSDRLSPEEWAPYQAGLRDEAFVAYLDMVVLDRVTDPRPRVPMLVVGAGGDRIITEREVRRTAEVYGAECEVFPGLGHNVMIDPEWRLVADRVLAWIAARVPGPRGVDSGRA